MPDPSVSPGDCEALRLLLKAVWPEGDPDVPPGTTPVRVVELVQHGEFPLFVTGLQYVDPESGAQRWYPHAMGTGESLADAVRGSLTAIGMRERKVDTKP